MANNTTSNNKYKLVCCLNCKHALLHRYGNNPILAACQQKPQQNPNFPYEVQVACHLRRCDTWEFEPQRKTIEQRSKVA